MPIISGEITGEGPIIDVLVRVSQPREEKLIGLNMVVPQPYHIRALIDTGSSLTGFHCSVFQQLQIGPVASIPLLTPSTPRDAPYHSPVYDVRLTFVSGMDQYLFSKVRAIETLDLNPDSEERLLGIIGRDILDRCSFEYIGPDKRFRLHL